VPINFIVIVLAANLSSMAKTLPSPLWRIFANRWQSFEDKLRTQGLGFPRILPASLPMVWATSDFVADFCLRYPTAFFFLIESGRLFRQCSHEELSSLAKQALSEAEDEAGFKRLLRRFRHQELARIAWRDLTGEANLDEVLTTLSSLAEICVESALRFAEILLEPRFGFPRDANGQAARLTVLAMGKLGGKELNFSSDIDIVFAFSDGAATYGSRMLDRQSYFIRLGQILIGLLSAPTEDGLAYRVDMRLRPFGDAGPLAMSFDAMEEYYQRHGREWERYALIKARPIAGDIEAGRRLLERLRPFIYRRYLDYGAFAALREMKGLIDQQAARKDKLNDIKLSAGGIREVEFIAQVFQLVRGGRDPGLQTSGLRETLACEAERGLLPDWEEAELQSAYVFLRRVENRLQMMSDQQIHALPKDELGRLRLAWSMGYGENWNAFAKALETHMHRVHAHFQQTFASPQIVDSANDTQKSIAVWQAGDEHAIAEILNGLGYAKAAHSAAKLVAVRESRSVQGLGEMGWQRISRLMPLLIRAAAAQNAPDIALERSLKVIQSVASRSVYLALLAENPLVLSQLVKLCAASPWISQRLASMPLLLDDLLDPRLLYAPPDRIGLAQALKVELTDIEEDDLEAVMDCLRHFKESQVLKVAAADIMDALPLMQVSDHLTWIAEVILKEVAAIARADLSRRHGEPRLADGRPAGFGVIGYGKLGGLEMGYGSDLDLVFLYESEDLAASTDGARPLEAPVFFARLAQRIAHMLTAYTPAGKLYEVDIRLRPSGASGLLVSTLPAFAFYQAEKAWTWEHQALVRARFVAGDARVGQHFDAIRREVLARPRDVAELREAVRKMRERMWRELGNPDPEKFDLKKDPGGIADIEFLVQYKVLAHACECDELLGYTDTIRLLEQLAKHGFLPAEDAGFLAEAYKTLRDRIHALTLQDQPSVVSADEFQHLRERVGRIWKACFDPGNTP